MDKELNIEEICESVMDSKTIDTTLNIVETEESEDTVVTEEDVDASLNEIANSNDPSTKMAKELKKKTKKTMSQLADEVVADYLNDRSDKNWTKLQTFFWYGIKQFAYKYTHNLDDAYDMTIETFISALHNIDNYDSNKAKFSTWLWTICRNNCIHLIKERTKIPTVDNDISDLYDSAILGNACVQNIPELKVHKNNLEEMTLDDIVTNIYNISMEEIGRMDETSKTIIDMKLFKNKKIREIAVELNMNESTVKNYLYKAKENLSRIIQRKHKNLYDIYIDMKSSQDDALGI